MYTKKAIERLNNINWDNIGQNGQMEDMELGIKFVKNMAAFCKANNIKPTLPFMTDLPSFFDNCEVDNDIINKCNNNVKKIIKNPSVSTALVYYYLHASILADLNLIFVNCMEVYEPIILLFERGGNFVYRERGMSFINSGLIPLTNWFDNFKN